MPIHAIRSEKKCKICSYAERPQIDDLLEQRFRGQMTYDEVIAKTFEQYGYVVNIVNVRTHFNKHCQIVSASKMAQILGDEYGNDTLPGENKPPSELARAVLEMCEREFGEGWENRLLNNDEFLAFTRICAQHDMLLKIRTGERTGATLDHGLKSVDSGTRRKHSEATKDMQDSVGAAMERYANDAS